MREVASAARARRRWTGVDSGRPLRWILGAQPAAMDLAAGILIVREAGGVVTDVQGGSRIFETAASLLAILRFRAGFFLSFRQLGKLHKDEYGVSSARCCRFCLPRDFGKVAGASVMRLE